MALDRSAERVRRDTGITQGDFYGLNCVQVGNEVRLYAGTDGDDYFLLQGYGPIRGSAAPERIRLLRAQI